MIIITGRARNIRILSSVVLRRCFSHRCKKSSNLYKLVKHISRTAINPPVFPVSTHCDWLKKTNSQKVCLLVHGFDLLVLYYFSSWYLKLFSFNQRASPPLSLSPRDLLPGRCRWNLHGKSFVNFHVKGTSCADGLSSQGQLESKLR